MTLTPEAEDVGEEEFEVCLRTLERLWQAPKVSPMDIQKSVLPELAQKSIKEKLDWIDERFSSAIENFENETERGLALLQSRRMLREQVWPYFSVSPFHKRLLTLLINSIDRVKPKSMTIAELNLLREKTALLSAKELTKQETLEVEGALLTIE